MRPTVGRKLWYRASKFDLQGPGAMAVSDLEPLDATVLAVWGDRMVNVLVYDVYGKPFPKLSVTLLQPGDEPVPVDDYGRPLNGYVEWMPHQVKTAGMTF
jgi:hypothetical protein